MESTLTDRDRDEIVQEMYDILTHAEVDNLEAATLLSCAFFQHMCCNAVEHGRTRDQVVLLVADMLRVFLDSNWDSIKAGKRLKEH